MAIHLFQYDIPEVNVVRRGREVKRPVIPNPSSELWRSGAVRLTLSCWLVHDGSVPPMLVQRFRLNGVKWNSAPFDPNATAVLAAMALENIQKEIRMFLDRARNTQSAEDRRLAETDALPGSAEARAAHARYRGKMRYIGRRVRRALDNIQIAAQRFGIASDTGVESAQCQIDVITNRMKDQAEAYATAHDVIVKERGKSDAMARAMRAGDVFGPVAADYLDEIGSKKASNAAKNLRKVFDFDF
jgi:hypothetical protein